MAEMSAGVENSARLQCISVVLKKCVVYDEARMKKLAFLLRDDDIITKDERIEIMNMIKTKGSCESIERIIQIVQEKNKDVSCFVTALNDEDLEMGVKVTELLSVICSQAFNESHVSLIQLWNELETYNEILKQLIVDIWQDKATEMTENTDWPLHFIQFCITSTDNEEKLDSFLSAAKMVQPPVGTIADEEFNQELCEKEGDSPASLSSEPESFVFLPMGDENGEDSAEESPETSRKVEQHEPSTQEKQDTEYLKNLDNSVSITESMEEIFTELEGPQTDGGMQNDENSLIQSDEQAAQTMHAKPPPKLGNGDEETTLVEKNTDLELQERPQPHDGMQNDGNFLFHNNEQAAQTSRSDPVSELGNGHEETTPGEKNTEQNLQAKPDLEHGDGDDKTTSGKKKTELDSQDEKTPHVIDRADGEQEIDSMSDDDEDDDDSEVDVMEQHQMGMLFPNDQGVPVIPTAPSFEDVLNKSNSTNVDQQFNVEFRVIPTELPRSKFGGKMLVEIHGQFYPMKTHKHGYYSTNVVTQTEDLGYVYCYTVKSNKYIYEKLPSSGKTKLRERSFTPGFNIVQDIACFPKTSWIVDTWKKNCLQNIRNYLPSVETVLQQKISFKDEIYYWVHNLKLGWKISSPVHQFICNNGELELMLEKWFVAVQKFSSDDVEIHLFKHIICCIAIIRAFYLEHHVIQSYNLYSALCDGLNMCKLVKESQIRLYHEIEKEFQFLYNGVHPLHEVCESLQHFLDNDLFSCSFILVLPAYWLIAEKGQFKDQLRFRMPNLLLDRAMLPDLKQSSWGKYKEVLSTLKQQKKLKELNGTIQVISQVHPWIVDTFQYFLTSTSLIDLLMNKVSSINKFQLDSIFQHILPLLDPIPRPKLPAKKISEYAAKILKLDYYLSARFGKLMQPEFLKSLQPDYLYCIASSSALVLENLSHALIKLGKCHIFDNSNRLEILWVIKMAVHAVLLHQSVENMGMTHFKPDVVASFTCILDGIKLRISEFSHLRLNIDANEIKFYNDLLQVRWAYSNFQDDWISDIKNDIEDNINEEWSQPENGKGFLNFYFGLEGIELCEYLDSILEKKAEHYSIDVLYQQTDHSFFVTLLHYFRDGNDKSVKIIGKIFEQGFSEYEKNDSSIRKTALEFLSRSPFPLRFFKVFNIHDVKIMGRFRSTQCECVEKVANVMKCILADIEKEITPITLEEFDLMFEHEERIIELLVLFRGIKTSQPRSSSAHVGDKMKDMEFRMIFTRSRKTIQLYNDKVKFLYFFINLCKSFRKEIKVDCERLEYLCDRDRSSLCLGKLYKDFILDEEMFCISDVAQLEGSKILYSKLQQLGNVMLGKKSTPTNSVWNIDWRHVLNNMWLKTRKEISKFCSQLDEGTMKQERLLDTLDFTDGDEAKIKCELLVLYKYFEEADSEKKSTLRARQIAYHFKIQRSMETIQWISDFQKSHNLKGDFSAIHKFQGTFQDGSVEDFEKLRAVIEINKKQLDVLKAFSKQAELIKWLQTKMTDESDVRGLCMVAMESTRHEPMYADKWLFLSDGVAGFEKLIFHLDKLSGLKGLLRRCKTVWKNVESDGVLLSKWADSGKDIEWYKANEQWYGSEEKAVLCYAQEVNNHGVYTIGNLQKTNSNFATLKESIKLDLSGPSETNGDGNDEVNAIRMNAFKKNVDIDYLHEVESKLMLISGDGTEGQKDVLQFQQLLNATENLAQAYVDLVNAGFMLFTDWNAIISSKPSKDTDMMTEHILVLNITFKKGVQKLGKTASIQDINVLADILKNILKRWDDHVKLMRLKHYYLNDFSIQQIKYLCQQLGKMRQCGLEDRTYVMLSDLQRHEMTGIIGESLNEAMKIDDANEETNNTELVNDESEDNVTKEVFENREKRKAVRFLVNSENVPETLAKAAVQEEGFADLNACSNWMLLHEYDENIIFELSQAFDQTSGFVYDQNDIKEDRSILQSRSAKTLEGIIAKLQESEQQKNDILVSIKTICLGYLNSTMTLTLKDYLSVSHLGKFLTILHSKMDALQGQAGITMRNAHSTLIKGSPNFLLCQEQEVIPLLISLYATDENDPKLPTFPEVLLCSEETTVDEVERFMLRAMTIIPSEADPLFCLACAHKLDLNVSKALETMYGFLTHAGQYVRKKFQLVIISSDPQHYITALFDKFQIEKIPSFEEKILSEYVSSNMSNDTSANGRYAQVVQSIRSGVGKSLYVKKIFENVEKNTSTTTIRLLERHINIEKVIKRLYMDIQHNEQNQLIHFDLTPAVEIGIEKFMFDLLILGMITDSTGKVWRCRQEHSYYIEMKKRPSCAVGYSHTLELLPSIECISPVQVVKNLANHISDNKVIVDIEELNSDIFQRPYYYLQRHEKNEDITENYAPNSESLNQSGYGKCVEVLLRHCGMNNPSWGQMKHFVSFLNTQLVSCEESVFCQMMEHELKGLKNLAVKFMIRMSQDFATPSLYISDESANDGDDQDIFEAHQLRRKWEEYEHPYVFFNDDGVSMSFINVNIDKYGNLLDKNQQLVQEGITTPDLVAGLGAQGIELGHNFHKLSRTEMIKKLCLIMGVNNPDSKTVFDPDPSYELTTDNVLKMIAIYMRFRCKIPVIIMGETGCGKTRMIEFMNSLMMGKKKEGNQMQTLKIHGGIGVEDIHKSVNEALNNTTMVPNKMKILFYDEANTTIAIYAIKEVMCDLTIDGKSFEESNIQIVAACNPYKQLSPEAIKKLESSGLGYLVSSKDSNKCVGNIAIRTLVYKVVALPPSIQPFVWDFGQLSDETEQIYIEKMTDKLSSELAVTIEDKATINLVLSRAQAYMKKQEDECRYVSLRDVERTLKLYKWFFKNKEIYPKIQDILKKRRKNRQPDSQTINISDSLRSLLYAIDITYHVSLEKRQNFRMELSHVLEQINIHLSSFEIKEEFVSCQTLFHRNLKSMENVAWNEALCENVYLMTICADAKLPLYLVGKPGSSKSLSKTIVEANMKGSSSTSSLYRSLKKVEFLTFQCSALTEASGIEKMFSCAAERQKNKDLSKFGTLVVLDEIGLAEDSPNMPLKILHPLLECGSASSGTLTEFDEDKKVAFIGISNWALDPAKMNRGIFVSRNVPREDDLSRTAEGIFEGSQNKANEYHSVLEKLTKTYLDIYQHQNILYFGLRDYYSLIKMLCKMSKEDRILNNQDFAYMLLRNFSGGDCAHLQNLKDAALKHFSLKEDFVSAVSLKSLIADNLQSFHSRFLLLLTSDHSSVNLLHHIMPDFNTSVKVLFGSSFPGDNSYTWFCRIINRIKVCMETGLTVVLLNMSKIHESLYDVLNQQYVKFGGQNYVAIGLGSHRVWSRIHDNFRIIIVEKKEIVRDRYPIALINRLEKHHLLGMSLLSEKQCALSKNLQKWCQTFSTINKFTSADAFVGFHSDTTSSVILAHDEMEETNIFKKVMLNVATADSVFRLSKTRLSSTEKKELLQIYMETQTHDCLFNLLQTTMNNGPAKIQVFEIVSFSNILTEEDRKKLETKLDLVDNSIMLLSLQQFKVQEEYTKKLNDFFVRCMKNSKDTTKQNVAILLIQISKAYKYGKLVECAKHHFMNNVTQISEDSLQVKKVLIGFLLSTERGIDQKFNDDNTLILQHTNKYKAVYVDELRHSENNTNTTLISSVYKKSIGNILLDGKNMLCTESNDGRSHIICLLQDCICESMSHLTSQENGNGRELQCIEILQQLFIGQSLENISKGFLQILFEKMITFESHHSNDIMEWLTTEACSVEKLQESGTFGKAIHIRLKQRVANMLAYVISIIDENNNLSLLTSSNENGSGWRTELWLQLFSIIEMKIPSDKNGEFVVRTAKHLTDNFDCKFPFSFVINEKLMHLYKSSISCGKDEIFFYNLVKRSTEKEIVKVLSMWNSANKFIQMMETYAYDVVKFLFRHGTNSQTELDGLVKVLFEISKQKWLDLNRCVNGISITFLTFMQLSEEMKMISDILKISSDIGKNIDQWLTEQQKASEFLIHQLALEDLLAWVNSEAGKINDAESCIEWLNLISNMKKTFYSIISSTHSEERRKDLEGKWKPLALLDMLLMNLLPNVNEMQEYTNFVSVVVKQAMRMFNGVQRMGFNSIEVLKITSVILRKCYENLQLNFMVDWKSLGCIPCGKIIQVPIKMPCGEFICKDCAQIAVSQEIKLCPLCPESLPPDFSIHSPSLTKVHEDYLKIFQKKCTSFFLEYLHNFCFEISHPSDHEKKIRIFEDIFVSSCSREQKELKTTALNFDIELKSSVFQLLYKISPEFLEKQFDELLQNDRLLNESILLSALKGFENIFSDQDSVKNDYDWSEQLLRESWKHLSENKETAVSFEIIKHVSQLRIALNHLVNCIHEYKLRNIEEMTPKLILTFADISNKFDPVILKKFFTKTFLMMRGKQQLKSLCDDKHGTEMIVKNYLQDVFTEIIDFYIIYDADFSEIRKDLANSRQTQENFDRWFPRKENVLMLKNIPKISTILHSKNSKAQKLLFTKLRRQCPSSSFLKECNVLNELSSIPGLSVNQASSIQQLVLLVIHIVACKPYLLQEEAFALIADPASTADLFWPAMPESLHNAMDGILLDEAPYTCPNGHVYYIGECRRPWIVAKCPECNVEIGGTFHVKSQGNERMDTGIKSQCGYQLHYDKKGVDNPGDRTTEQGAATLQFILHSCMLFAMNKNPDIILRMICESNVKEGQNFLMNKLMSNLESLSQHLGRNVDDGILVLHLILKRIIDEGENLNMTKEQYPDWTTMENRKEWEKEFQIHYLTPVFCEMEELLVDIQEKLITDTNASSKLNRFLDETKSNFKLSELSCFHPSLWKLIQHSNSSHLLHCIAVSTSSGEVLQNILKAPNLHLVQHLEIVLKVQGMMIQKFQDTYDMKDVEGIAFVQIRDHETYENGKLIDNYIKIWNQVSSTSTCFLFNACNSTFEYPVKLQYRHFHSYF
ncbi:E3 ubiquitin-protein ligase rnf213-alpha-like isoform X3 [Styela clava]